MKMKRLMNKKEGKLLNNREGGDRFYIQYFPHYGML